MLVAREEFFRGEKEKLEGTRRNLEDTKRDLESDANAVNLRSQDLFRDHQKLDVVRTK